jgi:hypothetical protein
VEVPPCAELSASGGKWHSPQQPPGWSMCTTVTCPCLADHPCFHDAHLGNVFCSLSEAGSSEFSNIAQVNRLQQFLGPAVDAHREVKVTSDLLHAHVFAPCHGHPTDAFSIGRGLYGPVTPSLSTVIVRLQCES